MNAIDMTPSIVLVLAIGVLFAAGVYLLLERSLTRVLLGFILMGNGANLLFLVAGGRAGGAPIVGTTPEEEMSDPLVQAMVLTAIVLLSFTYLGSQAGKEQGGPEGIALAQQELAGYKVLFEEGVYETCGSCHQLGGVGNGGPGPNLDAVGTRYDSADDIVEVLANGLGGGAMPVKGGSAMTDEQAARPLPQAHRSSGQPHARIIMGAVGHTIEHAAQIRQFITDARMASAE